MAFVQSEYFPFFHASNVGVSFPSNVTSGNTIVVGIIHSYFGCPVSISDNLGTSYTKVVDRNSHGSDSRYLSVWIGVVASSAAVTITPTYSCGFIMFGFIAEYSGLAASPFDLIGSNESTTTSVNFGSVTTTEANELIIGIGRTVVGNTWGSSSGTIREIEAVNNNGIFQDQIQASIGTVNPSAVSSFGTINATFPFFGWTIVLKQSAPTSVPGFRGLFGRWWGGLSGSSNAPSETGADVYIPIFRRRRR